MYSRILTLALTGLALLQAGCAAGVHAGGARRGVGVGAAVGPAPPALVAPIPPPEGGYVAPQPVPR